MSEDRVAGLFAATRLIVRTAPVCSLRVLLFGNTERNASYVADSDDSDDGLKAAPNFVGATGRQCPCGALGNRWELHRRNRLVVDN